MDRDIVTFTAKTLLRDLRQRVQEAAGMAKAAKALADAGLTSKAVEVANDMDDPIHELERLLGLVAVVMRSADHDGDHTRNPAAERDGHDQPAAEPIESVPATPVDATLADVTVRTFLALADERLHVALGIARAAEIRAAFAGPEHGVRLALDVEPLLYEVRHFINTASIMNCLGKARAEEPPD